MRGIRFAPRKYIGSVWRDARISLARVVNDRAALVTIIVLILPWWSLIFLRANFDWLPAFGQIGAVVFAYWWLSRSGDMPAPTVRYPRAESLFAFALIVGWIGWRTAICGKFFSFFPPHFVCFQNWEFEIIPKLAELVVVPTVILFLVGYRWRAQGLDLNVRAWWISSLAILGVIAYGILTHRNDLLGFGHRTVEYFFGAGLPEEVLFRAFLLTRLEAWWRNSAWALLGSSIIFGLTHLPIDFFVFSPHNWNETWITLLTFQMGMGAAFAFAYQRSRNVWSLALLHALVDAL